MPDEVNLPELPFIPEPLSPQMQRALRAHMLAHWPDGQEHPDADFAEEIARFIFEHELIVMPHSPALTAERVAFYPVSETGHMRGVRIPHKPGQAILDRLRARFGR